MSDRAAPAFGARVSVSSNRVTVEEYRTVVIAAGSAIIAIIVVAILVAVIRRRRRARASQAPLPLIPFASGRGTVGPPRPDGTLPPAYGARPDFASAPTPAWSAPIQDPQRASYGRSPYAPPSGSGSGSAPAAMPRHGAPNNPLVDTAVPNDAVAGTAVDGASVRYWRPADGTLQFLPGRLEVIAGRDSGQEIRFVRTPGPDGTRVTFGRAEGAPYRHVQLREPTVSRAHARMTLENGAASGSGAASAMNGPRWRLENLSATNPVVVNGRPLAADGGDGCSVALDEGDRIEMGEVVFRFHEK